VASEIEPLLIAQSLRLRLQECLLHQLGQKMILRFRALRRAGVWPDEIGLRDPSAPLHGPSLFSLSLVHGLARLALLLLAWKLLYLCWKTRAVQDVALNEIAVACGLLGLFLEADGGLAIAALSLAGGQLPRQQVPFLEGPHRRPQGRFEGMRLLGEQGFGMEG